MVDINRAVEDIKGGASVESVSEKFDSITRAALFDPKAVVNSEFVVKEIDHDLYIFEYREKADIRPLIYMNIGLGIAIISASFVLIYIGRKILRPFHMMSDYSVQLARGNLSAPVKEDKNKFFGKFLWGINMLRDNLESNKERELELQKDKKTLILSLSHDIKTPLSAIKLYSRALDENIYETDEERKNAVSGIAHNAEEIEKYVSDIVAASKEDFLNLEAEMKEFYLAEVMDLERPGRKPRGQEGRRDLPESGQGYAHAPAGQDQTQDLEPHEPHAEFLCQGYCEGGPTGTRRRLLYPGGGQRQDQRHGLVQPAHAFARRAPGSWRLRRLCDGLHLRQAFGQGHARPVQG